MTIILVSYLMLQIKQFIIYVEENRYSHKNAML